MNLKNLFYIRYLQLRYYGRKNSLIQALFSLEDFFFEMTNNVEENLIIKIKLKWLEEEIEKENFENPIIKDFFQFTDKKLKKSLLGLIYCFSKIVDTTDEKNLIKNFQDFNYQFNLILKNQNYNCGRKFQTSYFFQTIFFLYNSDIFSRFNMCFFNDLFRLMDKAKFDTFELVFLESFFDKKNFELKKIKKIKYLLRLLFKFFSK